MKRQGIIPNFAEFIPDHIEEGVLYISEPYQTAIHKCCCGCGEEVVTPFSPVDWQLLKGEKGVSLNPSIGNWNYKCQSHYFIRNNQVVWAGQMNSKEIQKVQCRDLQDKQNYIAHLNTSRDSNKNKRMEWLTSWLVSTVNWIKSLFK